MKKVEVAILTSDKINLKVKTITRYKEGHYIMTNYVSGMSKTGGWTVR